MARGAKIPLPCRIVALMQERNRLFAFPADEIERAVRMHGFRCTQCGRCCTRTMNDHVFLLDQDVARARKIDPAAIEPAPDPEFCDQEGTVYVSGYALKMKDDAQGSCWFLDDNRCRIYHDRFSVCRIYPHMLRKVVSGNGGVSWIHLARPGEHGEHGHEISPEECAATARTIREYENAFLSQQISFLETVHEYFTVHGLYHDRGMLDRQMQRFNDGGGVDFAVYHAGALEHVRFSGKGGRGDCRGPACMAGGEEPPHPSGTK